MLETAVAVAERVAVALRLIVSVLVLRVGDIVADAVTSDDRDGVRVAVDVRDGVAGCDGVCDGDVGATECEGVVEKLDVCSTTRRMR